MELARQQVARMMELLRQGVPQLADAYHAAVLAGQDDPTGMLKRFKRDKHAIPLGRGTKRQQRRVPLARLLQELGLESLPLQK